MDNMIVWRVRVEGNIWMFLRSNFVDNQVINNKRGKTVEKVLESSDADFIALHFFGPVLAQKLNWLFK